jgi:hypothetical protein
MLSHHNIKVKSRFTGASGITSWGIELAGSIPVPASPGSGGTLSAPRVHSLQLEERMLRWSNLNFMEPASTRTIIFERNVSDPSVWWSARRWRYNVGLIIAGITAFVTYLIVLSVFSEALRDAEVSLFTTAVQAVAGGDCWEKEAKAFPI